MTSVVADGRCMHMRRYIRAEAAGATFFFTVVLQDRSARYLVDHIAELRECIRLVKQRHPFEIEGMVVLPEHLHAIWRLPPDDPDFSSRWMLIKQSFTRKLEEQGALAESSSAPRGRKGERNVWQRRSWEHQIRDQDDLVRHLDYIHFNPVKHGWVLRARDWPYSSLHRFVRQGQLPADWGISAAIQGQFGE